MVRTTCIKTQLTMCL